MTPNRLCKTCSSSSDQDGTLFCRLNPPQVTIVLFPSQDSLGRVTPQLQTLASQPSVKPDGWCKQWAPEFKLQS